ncbi:MAG: phosphopantothenoylcysteine decarboxylase, partial [Candidatus Nanopelagicales bacterium]
LTGVDTGKGRMAEPEQLALLCEQIIARSNRADTAPFTDLAGRTVVVTAGGTREPLDPVRFLGNRSSGRQGYALASTAAGRGARVVLVAANVEQPDPAGVEVRRVSTAAELRQAVLSESATADAVVMAAAVADFRPVDVSQHKRKKEGSEPEPVQLTRTSDVLVELVESRHDNQVIVGFAAETGDDDTSWLDHGREKLSRKGCDLLVVNRVGDGLAFGTDDNAAVILAADGSETEVKSGPKYALADVVWDLVSDRLT